MDKIGFEKEDTLAVKGVAILLMLFHRMAAFPDRWPQGFGGFAHLGQIGADLALNGVFCVPLFFFLGGYGLYKKRQSGSFDLWDTVAALYRRYWKVFLVFVPVAFLCFHSAPSEAWYARYTASTPKEYITVLLGNFLGYRATLNSEWWFFGAYLCALPLGCLFCRLLRRQDSFLAGLFTVGAVSVLTQALFPALAALPGMESLGKNIWYARFFQLNQYAPAFLAGVVFAKHDALTALKKRLAQLPCPALTGLAGCGAVLLCRTYVTADVVGEDILLAPLFTACFSTALDSLGAVKRPFVFLGRNSGNMWLIHTFYCYYFPPVARIVYCTGSVAADLVTLLWLSLGSSLALDWLYRQLGRALSRLRTRRHTGVPV